MVAVNLSKFCEISVLDVNKLVATLQSQSSSGFDKEYWESQNLAFVNHLKVLSIDLSSGSNEIEFAKYILENAPHLTKIVIRYRLEFQQSDTL